MTHILAGILSLKQHLLQLNIDPQTYCPPRCPHCLATKLWHHGAYLRKPERMPASQRLDQQIVIPRYLCPQCGKTCSSLPECIAPKRWYIWSVQQAVLLALLNGHSLNDVSKQYPPSRQTCRRWWRQLQSHFILHSSTLRCRFSTLGRSPLLAQFWSLCFDKLSLSGAMYYLYQDGVKIP